MRKILVAGNWKLNGSLGMCNALLRELVSQAESVNVEMAVCPPAAYLQTASGLIEDSSISLGAQDVSAHATGAYTGEISAEMLSEVGCSMVLCGHSERRSMHGESNALVAAKCKAALSAGLQAVLCVGETEDERSAGKIESVVGAQVGAVLDVLSTNELERLIIAYEPVWAIGTGKTASSDQAQEVHAFIRCQIEKVDATIAGRLRILYGGSVKGSNAAELFAQPDIDGGLIGGASLKAEDFLAICRA